MKLIPGSMLCRILMFVWSFGTVCRAFNQARPYMKLVLGTAHTVCGSARPFTAGLEMYTYAYM